MLKLEVKWKNQQSWSVVKIHQFQAYFREEIKDVLTDENQISAVNFSLTQQIDDIASLNFEEFLINFLFEIFEKKEERL